MLVDDEKVDGVAVKLTRTLFELVKAPAEWEKAVFVGNQCRFRWKRQWRKNLSSGTSGFLRPMSRILIQKTTAVCFLTWGYTTLTLSYWFMEEIEDRYFITGTSVPLELKAVGYVDADVIGAENLVGCR